MTTRRASDPRPPAARKARSGSTGRVKTKRTLRLYCLDGLRMPRCWMWGPRWRKYFNVHAMPIAEVRPAAAPWFSPSTKLLVFSFEDDLREMVLEELRPGVYAQWSDPRERYG